MERKCAAEKKRRLAGGFWMAVNTTEHKKQHKCQPLTAASCMQTEEKTDRLVTCRLGDPGHRITPQEFYRIFVTECKKTPKTKQKTKLLTVRDASGNWNGARRYQQKSHSTNRLWGLNRRNWIRNVLKIPLTAQSLFSSETFLQLFWGSLQLREGCVQGIMRGDLQPNMSISWNLVSGET